MDVEAKRDSDSMRSEIISLIAKQRLLRLNEGGKFHKYNLKGQRIKDKYWVCKLSQNERFLQYGDIDDSRDTQVEELSNRINVSDIKKVFVGKDCPHTKDGHMKKSTIDLAFSILYESDHEDYLNFVAVDQKTFNFWTDGLNALLKNDMASDDYHKDLSMLYKIETKIRDINK